MNLEKWGLALGRLLLSLIFIVSGIFKLTGFAATAGVMANMGVPLPKLALVITILIEVGGGLLLLTGFKARYAALVMALWLVPVTLVFHNPTHQDQNVHFMKNLAIIGGLLVTAAASRSMEVAAAQTAGRS
jgi:putative oxidoreductase